MRFILGILTTNTRIEILNHGAIQFRQALGKFLAHYEKQHYAKRERDILGKKYTE